MTNILGEVVLVYLRNAGPAQQAGVAIASPSIEKRLGDDFLVGHVPSHARDWASGLEVAVRCAEIQHYLIFRSIDEYETRLETAPAYWEALPGATS